MLLRNFGLSMKHDITTKKTLSCITSKLNEYGCPCKKTWTPKGSRDVADPIFSRKTTTVVRLSVLRAGRALLPRKTPDIRFCYSLSQSQDYTAAGRITYTEKIQDNIGTRTRDLSAYSIVPQPYTLPRVLLH
jgi:hypothetical protein